jgi:hypothetical protein
MSLSEALREPWLLGHISAALAALLMTFLACYPIIAFVQRGWAVKKQEVVNSLSECAKKIYLEAFLKQKVVDATNEFEAIYQSRYGRNRLIAPSALLALATFPLMLLVAERALAAIAAANGWAPSPARIPALLITPITAIAAIVGAYTWTVWSLIAATVSHNLPPSLVLSSVLRLVVAVPMGYAVASLASPALAPVIAFAIGAFPLSTIQLLLQKFGSKQLNLDVAAEDRRDQVANLSGIDSPIADRLKEADITTIPQLAYCDPVQVSMRTNLGFQFTLDLVGQALAWIYFGEKLASLRVLGLRGAVEVATLVDELDAEDAKSRAAAEATFTSAAKLIGIEPPLAFRSVLREIAEDPYTAFVAEVWDDAGIASSDSRSDTANGTESTDSTHSAG